MYVLLLGPIVIYGKEHVGKMVTNFISETNFQQVEKIYRNLTGFVRKFDDIRDFCRGTLQTWARSHLYFGEYQGKSTFEKTRKVSVMVGAEIYNSILETKLFLSIVESNVFEDHEKDDSINFKKRDLEDIGE